MWWLDRKQRKTLDRHRANLIIATLPDVLISPPQAWRSKPGCLSIDARAWEPASCLFTTHSYSVEPVLFESPKPSEVELSLEPRKLSSEELDFPVVPRSTDLPGTEDAIVVSTAIDHFRVIISRFSFGGPIRELPTLISPPRPAGIRGTPLTRVKPKPKPPSLEKADLEERLRWILTPPIHELLSDPQLALPEKPFPFQTIGIKWLYDRHSALLADEMGLGKTMQALLAARLLWRDRVIDRILVVCPKTLIPTWVDEIRKWWPQASQNVMLTGADRQWFLRLATPNVLIKIINYAALQREAKWLKSQRFSHDLIIIDEAQRIKNPSAGRSQAVKALKGTRRWALTGTPLENKTDDVVSIFEFLEAGLLRYDNPEFLSARIQPYMLRRLTEEVLDELPEKIEQDIEIELRPEQRTTYDHMEQEGVLELNSKGDTVTVTHIFALISRLRQICNFNPPTGHSAKFERLLEDLEEVTESGRKALVFSQFVSEEYGLKRLAHKFRESHDPKYGALELHGGVPPGHRERVIQQFRTDDSMGVLLLNFQVGGVGLNLQAANYVFLFDRWWNPAVEDQAVKRAHRLGQPRKVFVRRFYCKDTIEERILQKLAEKRRLFRNVIDEGRPAPDSMGLSEEEIFSLFNLKVSPRSKSDKKQIPSIILPSIILPRIIIDNMDSRQFEELVAKVYEAQGFQVQELGGSHDAGIDILAEKREGGALQRVVIQCKHQQANVGRPVLQQLWGVVSADASITRGDCVISSGFTAEAKAFAEGKRLTLIDRQKLEELIREFKVAKLEPRPRKYWGDD